MEEKIAEIDFLKKDNQKKEQELRFKDEEMMEIGLNSNSLEKNFGGLQQELRAKDMELKEKKAKIKDYEKRMEILESENSKMTKVFHVKLQEIEDIKGRMGANHEVEELRNSNENFKKMNMVQILQFL